jgi:mannose-6-phosphate isomerase-like protein (cupin superfamily)
MNKELIEHYNMHMDVKFGGLELIDVNAIAAESKEKWFNQTLTKVNDSVVRIGVIEGEFHWHKHDNDDEFFYVTEGLLLIDLEDRTVELQPGQGMTVPKGVLHRTRAPQRTVILMVETASIDPTGD